MKTDLPLASTLSVQPRMDTDRHGSEDVAIAVELTQRVSLGSRAVPSVSIRVHPWFNSSSRFSRIIALALAVASWFGQSALAQSATVNVNRSSSIGVSYFYSAM